MNSEEHATSAPITDLFGRKWNRPAYQLCPTCHQPDDCGDCNHKPLNPDEVRELGGQLETPEHTHTAGMSTKEYTQLAKRTESNNQPLEAKWKARLLHSVLGCGDEIGELIKLVKDNLYYDKEITLTELKEEYGDLLWFVSLGLDAIGASIEEVMKMNIAKLHKRYPDKFTHDKAVNRDVAAELQVLEKFAKDIPQGKQEEYALSANALIWRGSPITSCQLCQQKINKRFIDGKTKQGPWAIMCPACHTWRGVGLGAGKGQEYILFGTTYVKIAI